MKAKDNTEVGVRLGCGALFGLVLGLSGSFHLLDSLGEFAGWVVASMVVCALAAWRFGDSFWYFIQGFFRFWYFLWPWRGGRR